MCDERPCDTELPADVREVFAQYVTARSRFQDAKVVDLTAERTRREIAAAVTNWLPAERKEP